MSDPALTQAAPTASEPEIKVSPSVFLVPATLTPILLLLESALAGGAERPFTTVQATVVSDSGWFYIHTAAGFFAFMSFLMIIRSGDVTRGLARAYFACRGWLPRTIRSVLFPLIGQRIPEPIGMGMFAVRRLA